LRRWASATVRIKKQLIFNSAAILGCLRGSLEQEVHHW